MNNIELNWIFTEDDKLSKKEIELIETCSFDEIINKVELMDMEEKIEAINSMREKLHEISPFRNEPVDYVRWVKNDKVVSNDYNPNKVAPPEMQLLEVSIDHDGYTQPIVSWPRDNCVEVIDGFHRYRVGKESLIINKRVMGYLPIVEIRGDRTSKSDRMASTIRHNRARGKHTVDAMSEIVLELKNRNWRNSRIAKELGMDEEEILRLCQISGLEDIFKDDDFSRSWNIEDSTEDDFEELTEEIPEEEKQQYLFRTANTSDPTRIFHTFDKWECHKAGFYENVVPGKTKEECENEYAEMLSNENEFREALQGVIDNWKHSCEHYLTNKAMNRIAWMGQAALTYKRSIPSTFRSGFSLLTEEQQKKANNIALEYINKWMEDRGRDILTLKEALSEGRQVEIY